MLAMVAGCLISSGNYGINEISDMEHDKYHPQKKNRMLPSGRLKPVSVFLSSVFIYLLGFGIAIFLKKWLITLLFILYFVNALFYNLQPLRLKDRPFLDFISEALNSPIRFLIGWYAVAVDIHKMFPVVIVFALWFFGIFLMSSKRFGEIGLIQDKEQLENFRKSMSYYSRKKLLFFMITSLCISYCLMGIFYTQHDVNPVILLPFVIIWTVWFFYLACEENTIVKDPGRIFEKIPFLLFSILCVTLFIWELISKM